MPHFASFSCLSDDWRADTLPEQQPENANCNCRGGTEKCSVNGDRCKDDQADVMAAGKTKEGYVGMSDQLRYNNHTDTFRHTNKRIRT